MDAIANMITSLKNAGNAGKDSVAIDFTNLKSNIAEVLKTEGFIRSFEKKMIKGRPMLLINLILENRIPKIKGVTRVSKSSKRIYKKADELRPVKNGYGAMVLSTPKGVMSGRTAKKEGVGGEVLFNIW